MLEDNKDLGLDLFQVIRLALSDQDDNVRLYAARLVRKYRSKNPELAEQINSLLRAKPIKPPSATRKNNKEISKSENPELPVDHDSRLALLKIFKKLSIQEQPMLSPDLEESLNQLVMERKQVDHLLSLGLAPTRSAIFVGPPGVGKTLTARWLADQLKMPLYVLDLTTVMSSLLGRSGSNLRSVLDFAKGTPCVLLLDEIDSIAKSRSDATDIGELKRLVTVILQEIEEWPITGLLLAATNYPDLIDPALWRRFDLVVEFDVPNAESIQKALVRFFGADYKLFSKWIDVLTFTFEGESFSNIEREIQRFRRILALGANSDIGLIEEFVRSRIFALDRQKRLDLAMLLVKQNQFTQHKISDVTGVSRDTIRKYSNSDLLIPKKKTTKGVKV